MNYAKTIVCCANSRKWSGRCIAGKEWQHGKMGEWVRPVSTRPTHELSMEEYCYRDGSGPQLLDILTISCLGPQPLPHQGENHVIDSSSCWSKQGELPWEIIWDCLDAPKTLWKLGQKSYTGMNNRLAVGQEDGHSLYLIEVDRLSLSVGCKASDTRPKRTVQGMFFYHGSTYRMDITDPVVEREYLARGDGQYDINDPVLCVSLGDPFEEYYYKLIAAVFYPERFA
jgi:hypothetical protein